MPVLFFISLQDADFNESPNRWAEGGDPERVNTLLAGSLCAPMLDDAPGWELHHNSSWFRPAARKKVFVVLSARRGGRLFRARPLSLPFLLIAASCGRKINQKINQL